MPPIPRPTGSGFEPYVWAATVAEIAARYHLSPAHILRFDANLPSFAARLPISPRRALASRGEYPEGSYRELREAAATYVGCTPEEIAVGAGADGLIGLVARTFLGPGRRAVMERQTYPLYAIATRLEGAEVEAAPRELDALAAAASTAAVLWLCNPAIPAVSSSPRTRLPSSLARSRRLSCVSTRRITSTVARRPRPPRSGSTTLFACGRCRRRSALPGYVSATSSPCLA